MDMYLPIRSKLEPLVPYREERGIRYTTRERAWREQH